MKKYKSFEEYSIEEAEKGSDLAGNAGWVRKKYIEFFTKMPISHSKDIDDIQQDIDDFCEKVKINADDFQYQCLVILADFFQYGKYNKAIGEKEISINPEELDEGIRFEMEHTKEPLIAKRIALDHLTDDKKYYTHLHEMEEKYKDGEPKEDEDSDRD